MVDNPFANGTTAPSPTEPPKDNPPPESTQPTEESKAEVVDSPVEESPLSIVQRILSKYDGLESNVPTNLVEYWNAKRRL